MPLKKFLSSLFKRTTDERRFIKECFSEKYRKIKIDKHKTLGTGGNAVVYPVVNREDGKHYALKQLQKNTKESKGRFKDEFTLMNNNWRDIVGIMPIYDSDINHYWYTMPIAIQSLDYIRKERPTIYQIGREFIKLLETISELHKKGISHRDIKPANIYWFDGRFYIGDFGLVDFPENPNDFTDSEKGLGAVFTIAPEMKRNPKIADGKKADVYSLAKTLWMFITLDDKGFDGQYDYTEKTHALRLNPAFRNEHLVELEELLVDATNPDPTKRIKVDEFILGMRMWLMVSEDVTHAQFSDWVFVKKLIFKSRTPSSTSWTDRKDIVEILNLFSHIPASNHLLFADHGGLDLKSADLAAEEGCICLKFSPNGIYVIKPKALHFECFDNFPSFDYLLLEVDKLENKVGDMVSSEVEECVVEDCPGHYVSAQAAQYGVYDYDSGNPLPEGARLVHRYYGGNLLLVMKMGIYNQIPQTYDGRHSIVSPSDFRQYIERIIQVLQRKDIDKKEFWEVVRSLAKKDYLEIGDEQTAKNAPDDYAKSNYHKWNFLDCLPVNHNVEGHTIEYLLVVNDLEPFGKTLLEGNYYILADGSIGKEDSNKAFVIFGRDEYIDTVHKIEEKILGYVKADGFDDINTINNIHISPQIHWTAKPTHLFTKAEIQSLMRDADDRKPNKLVIDEMGYAKMINDVRQGNLYPVSHETWDAGNMYVGRYSSLSDLDSAYNDSLASWLEFLETGHRVYCDLNQFCDEKETIAKIKTFY